MSQVCPNNYRYQVCPHCKSKKLSPIALVHLAPAEWKREMSQVQRTGYICDNCERYHANHKTKHITDRAEMKRDIAGLLKYLNK